MAHPRVRTADFAHPMQDAVSPPDNSNSHHQPRHDTVDSHQGSGTGGENGMQRADSTMSQSHTLTPSRGGTLKKRQSLSRKNSLKRSGSKRGGSRPGSVRSLTFADDVGGHGSDMHSAFFTPVPTSGNPTEILANRFQVWRKVLKDLIIYFRDIQKSYETRSKSLYTLCNVTSNITAPPQFVTNGGISDAINVLRDYHKQSIAEGNKAKSIEEDVIVQLTGLRSDLGQKIKEIKGLSGDFKNNVDKETESTRRAVRELQDSLGSPNTDPKGDPYLVRLAVDRQLGRQIDEENYLHRAFLNLESSGRELESIVMGEIQKAYSAYAGIIKREADEAYEAVEKLRSGPLTIPRDFEWNTFVDNNEHFVDPRLPVRRVENITYPGKDEAAASEVRAGMLERKSKYLKSYTPGWYVLSTTHLHEFKSPDRIASQVPVMSLALGEQKLGSHSNADSASHKFMLKGRQSGGIHRGHSWVFRAESHDTMMAWFSDIRNLTEKTGAERNAFIQRSHARSLSVGSQRASSISSDGMEEDEADQVPYSATPSQADISAQQEKLPERPNPGGRFVSPLIHFNSFPSALNVDRGSHVPLSPSSNESSGDQEVVAAGGALPGSGVPFGELQVGDDETNAARMELAVAPAAPPHSDAFVSHQQQHRSLHAQENPNLAGALRASPEQAPGGEPIGVNGGKQPIDRSVPHHIQRHDSKYGDWMGMGPAAGNGGRAIGVAGAEAYRTQQHKKSAADHEEQPRLQAVEPDISDPVSGEAQKPVGHPVQGPIFAAIPSTTGAASDSAINADHTTLKNTEGSTSQLKDPARPIKESAERPSLASRVNTISDLHFPGEFPRGQSLADPS